MADIKVTKENVEEIINRMIDHYDGSIDEHDIRSYFGGWDISWTFEPLWFEAEYNSFEDLCEDFEEWLFDA